MRRCVIVGGAPIGRYADLRAALRSNDFFIFCDGGLRHAEALGATPDLIVGDFDSHPVPETAIETVVLPREKDDTDTVFAAREAVRRGFDDFLLLGCVGARLDHSLGNIALLLMLHRLGKRALLLDDHGEMEIVGNADIAEDVPYFSLLAVDGAASGVCIENAKYPLSDAVIAPDYAYAVSNEPLPGGASVRVGQGRLLLIRILRE